MAKHPYAWLLRIGVGIGYNNPSTCYAKYILGAFGVLPVLLLRLITNISNLGSANCDGCVCAEVTHRVRGYDTRLSSCSQNLYFYNNHPIRWVRLVGVIVAFDVYPNRITMTLDDSSGLNIEVFCKKDIRTVTPTIDTSVDAYGAIKLNRPLVQKDDEHVVTTSEGKVNLDCFNVGSVVKIKGGVSEFRGEKQVTLERIALVRTTNEEARAWAENSAFYQEVLCKPWVVNDRAQLRAKKRAVGLDKQREAKKGLKQRKRESAEKHERGLGTEQKRSRFGGDKTRATHDRLHVQARTR